MDELAYLQLLWGYWRARLDDARGEEGGLTTEAAILIAIMAALAIAVGGIITAKVLAKAQSIPTE